MNKFFNANPGLNELIFYLRTTIIQNKPDDILDFIVTEIFSAENIPELTKKYSSFWTSLKFVFVTTVRYVTHNVLLFIAVILFKYWINRLILSKLSSQEKDSVHRIVRSLPHLPDGLEVLISPLLSTSSSLYTGATVQLEQEQQF